MLVNEVMTRNVRIAKPNQCLQEVAQIMAEEGVGCLPVGENNHLLGMITDRDIAVRAVAQGKDVTKATVRDTMSTEVKYCFEDEDVEHVADNMSDIQLHRLPVVNHDKRLVGIVALADIANHHGSESAGRVVCGISGAPSTA